MIYVQKPFCDTFDVTATTQYVNASEFTLQGDKPIKTTGSSATVTAVTGGDAPFKYLAVNDVITVQVDATFTTRTIIAKASDDSVTVDAAVDWDNGGAGRHFRWRDVTAVAAPSTTGGLVNISGWQDVMVYVTVETYNFATNIVANIEGIVAGGTTPVALEDPQGNAVTLTFTGTGTQAVPIGTKVDSIRIALTGSGADSGTNYVTAWVGGNISPARG